MGSGRRMRGPALCAFVAFLLVQAASSAGTCKEGCPNPSKASKVNLNPGQKYTYKFETVATVHLAGKDAQETTVKLQGKATIFASDNCLYTLSVTEAFSFGPDGKKTSMSAELGSPVQFTMNNDELQPEICADGDTDFALNVKRGIVSMFQFSDKGFEYDVFGKCPTTMSVNTDGASTTITKVRDLSQCSYREQLGNGIMQGIVDDNADVKSAPLLNGGYTSESKIVNGVLESTQISEDYIFLPFSTDEAGARSKVVSKLTIVGSPSAALAPKLPNGKPKTILFETPATTTQGTPAALKSVFQKTMKDFDKSAAHFSELIRLMRHTKKDDLLNFYQNMKSGSLGDKEFARRVYFDALFRTGTGQSVETLTKLLQSKELNDKEQKLMYLSLNLVQSMTKEALNAVTRLLDKNPPKEAYLSVGHVISKYCHNHDCEDKDVKATSEKFNKKLGTCKPTNRNEEDTFVAVLKGIRNTHILLNPSLDKVVACTSDKTSTRIRVTALQAFAANPCNKMLQDTALALLKNLNEDSEIRIEAYLALVECPSGTLANELQSLIDSEPIYQVGSFITTHLSSLRASTDSTRQAARDHFRHLRTSKKYPYDPRRYSFNREFSYAVDSLGLGSSVDTNVIYSQRSFLPRSGRFNLTGELFGNSFNVLELNGRQENLDLFIEHYFGPKGILKSQSLQDMVNNLAQNLNSIDDQARERLRNRRGVREDSAAFEKTVKFASDVNSDLDLDFSVKLFGTELFFLSLGQNLPSTPKELLKYLLDQLDNGLQSAKSFDHTFEHHALFLDAEIVYPTAIGLPLKLNAKGSGVVRFQTSGQFDFKQWIKDPKTTKFQLKMIPTWDIQVSGMLSVDASGVQTGLEVSTSLYSGVGSDVKFEVLNGKGARFEVNLPKKDQDLLQFDHKIMFVTQERGQEMVALPLSFKTSEEVTFRDCFDQVQPMLGFVVCTEYKFTNPKSMSAAPFPLNGPHMFKLSLEVANNFLFLVEYNDDNIEEPYLYILYDTPGTNEKRKSSLKFNASFKEEHMMVGVALDSPISTLAAMAGFRNNEKELKLYANFKMNSQDEKLEVGLTKSGNAQKQEYTPVVKLSTYDLKVTGNIVQETNGEVVKYNFNNLQFTAPSQEPFSITGSVTREPSKVSADLDFSQNQKTGSVKGSIELAQTGISLDVALKSNFHDQANGKLVYKLTKLPDSLKNDLTAIYGNDLESKTKRVEINQYFEYHKEDKNISTKYENRIFIGELPLTLSLNGDSSKNAGSFVFDAQHVKQKLHLHMSRKCGSKAKGDYEVTVGAGLNEHTFNLNSGRTVENGDKSKITNKIESSFGVKAELNGLVGHTFTGTDADVNLQALLVPGPKQETFKVTIIISNSPKISSANAKVISGKTEFATYESKIQYGDQSKGTFKVMVNELFDGQGDFESKNGKGDGSALMTFKKHGRKLKVDTNFNVAKPTFDLSTDLYYDFEKDNTKKIHVETKNQYTKGSLDSKNKLEAFAEKYEFNVAGSAEGNPSDGKQTVAVEIYLPTGRRVATKLSRESRMKAAAPFKEMNVELSDEMPNKQQRMVSISGSVNSGDFKSGFFDTTHELKYKGFDGKDIILRAKVKNAEKGHFSAAAIHATMQGTLMPQPGSIDLVVDEYCANHAIYHVTGKYGAQYDVAVNGKFYVADEKRPHTHDVTATLNMPQETKLKKITVTSTGTFSEPSKDSDSYMVDYKGSLSYNDQAISVETTAKGGPTSGSGSMKLQLPQQEPLTADASYKYSGDKDQGSCNMEGVFNTGYGKGKKFHLDASVKGTAEKDITIKANMQSDIDKAKTVAFNLHAEKPAENTYMLKTDLTADSKSYAVNTKIVASEVSPLINLNVKYPENELIFNADSQKLGERKRKASVDVQNFGDFNLQANVEADYTSAKNFYLKGDLHSEKLQIKKSTFDIKTLPSGSGVEFMVTSEGKNVLSGSADYSTKVDNTRTIVEGQGNVKYYDQPNTASFKLIRNVFEAKRDGETGGSTIINVVIGKTNIAGELKATDKNFHVKYTMCPENQQCVLLEAKSNLEKTDMDHFKHVLMISADLRRFGYSHEFGLKADTSRNGYRLTHTVDIHLQAQDKPQYQYNIYIQPKEAGAVLTLPSRTVSIEFNYAYPTAQFFGKYDTTVSVYLNKKNKPDQKTVFGFTGEAKKNNKQHLIGNGELKFEHQGMKPLRVSAKLNIDPEAQLAEGNFEIDVFKNKNDEIVAKVTYGNTEGAKGFNITTDVTVSSKGLDLNLGFNGHAGLSFDKRQFSMAGKVNLPVDEFKFGTHMFLSEKDFEMVVIGFGEEMLRSQGSYDGKTQSASMSSTVKFLGGTPVTSDISLKGLTTGVFKMQRGNLLLIDGVFDITKEAHIKVVGSGKELFIARMALDQTHFLATTFKVHEPEIKEFVATIQQTAKDDVAFAQKKVNEKYTKVQDTFRKRLEKLNAVAPDLKSVHAEYEGELKKLVEELKADEALKPFIDLISAFLINFTEAFADFSKSVSERAEQLESIIKDFYTKTVDAFNEKILPDLKAMYTQVETIIFGFYHDTMKLLAEVFERVAKALKIFEEDFNSVAKHFGELTKGSFEVFSTFIETIRKEVSEIWELMQQQMQALPGFELIKKKYDELLKNYDINDQVKMVLKELLSTLTQSFKMTPECEDFMKKLNEYVDQKLGLKEVNDVESVLELIKMFSKAILSLPQLLHGYTSTEFQNPLPFSLESLKRLPYITSIRFSPFNYLRNEPLLSLRDFVYLYRPYAFDPAEMIPPFTLHASISDGQHIFTFDGRHLTFPGTCTYVLAQDFINGNFSLMANIQAGKMKSLTLIDKADTIEVTSKGIVTLNGSPADFPIHQNDIHAWRSFHSLSVYTVYGAEFTCSLDLRSCFFTVSGYYLGKTRGLLGNGNSEPYDDYLLPSNKITESTAEFGNAYRTQSKCAPVTATGDDHAAHAGHSSEFCKKFFSGQSTLRYCFFFVEPSSYREACEHASMDAADKQDAACNIALTYAKRCRNEKIPVSLPAQCAKCQVGDKESDVGDYYSVKTPQKQVDIVLVVDLELNSFEELVQNVAIDLRKELKGMNTQIAVIGYNKAHKYLYFYTKNGKLDYSGANPLTKSNGPELEKAVKTNNPTLDSFLETFSEGMTRLREDLGMSSDAQAFQAALAFPFRPTATKTIFAMRADSLTKMLSGIVSSQIAKKRGIGMHVLTPVNDLVISNAKDQSKAKQIVGFNNKQAVLLNEKKRQGLGNIDMKNNLKYTHDMGIDLVEKSNGFVFILQNYNDAKEKKKFINLMSFALADHISRTEVESECICTLEKGLYAESHCEAKETRTIPPKKTAGKG